MFKNLSVFRFTQMPSLPMVPVGSEFEPCGPTQEKSIGWVPPRGEANGALIELVGGQRILKLMTEVKVVPGQVLRKAVADECAKIEQSTGRKPGKKEKREIADDARLALLPHAFAKQTATLIWIDPLSGLLVIDSTSRARVDEALTALVKSFDGLVLQLVNAQTSPAAAMAYWLASQDAPVDFTVDRECELKACDESRAVVKYSRHTLDTDEVQGHIRMGKMPTKLALTWSDRVSFVLTDSLQIKKLTFLESVFEGEKQDEADAFDAGVAIATGELRKLLPALFDALGGEVDPLFGDNT